MLLECFYDLTIGWGEGMNSRVPMVIESNSHFNKQMCNGTNSWYLYIWFPKMAVESNRSHLLTLMDFECVSTPLHSYSLPHVLAYMAICHKISPLTKTLCQ